MNMHMSLNIKLLKFNMQPNLVYIYIYIGQSKGRNDYLPLNPLQRTK